MKILFIATRKNRDPSDRELYEMDLMNLTAAEAPVPPAREAPAVPEAMVLDGAPASGGASPPRAALEKEERP